MLEYKGYLGTAEYSAEDRCHFGKLAFIRDLVNYEATTVPELEQEFRAAVDDYLAACAKAGREPSVPSKEEMNSGGFQV